MARATTTTARRALLNEGRRARLFADYAEAMAAVRNVLNANGAKIAAE